MSGLDFKVDNFGTLYTDPTIVDVSNSITPVHENSDDVRLQYVKIDETFYKYFE